ncbi:MAG: hypothetical protein Q8N81_07485 [bacterium]|nr:hypothetical protein [bacterium]
MIERISQNNNLSLKMAALRVATATAFQRRWFNRVADLSGRAIRVVHPNYLLGLDRWALGFARDIKPGETIAAKSNALLNEKNEAISLNPLKKYLNKGVLIKFNFISPDELADLGRAIREVAGTYPVFDSALLAALVSKSHNLQDFNSWVKNLSAVIAWLPTIKQEADSKLLIALLKITGAPDELEPDPCEILSAVSFPDLLSGMILQARTNEL